MAINMIFTFFWKKFNSVEKFVLILFFYDAINFLIIKFILFDFKNIGFAAEIGRRVGVGIRNQGNIIQRR